ncbi:hypothetical protein [Segatella oris]
MEAFLTVAGSAISSDPVSSVGLNCSLGARHMKSYLKELVGKTP